MLLCRGQQLHGRFLQLSGYVADAHKQAPIACLTVMQERNGEPDFSKKHPLEYKWTLWFDNPKGTQNQNNWGQTLRAVYTFDTVEDFWW